MKKIKNILLGAAQGVILDIILILYSFICSYLPVIPFEISLDIFLGGFYVLPVILFVIYIIHIIREKPAVKKILLWHCGFALTGLILFVGFYIILGILADIDPISNFLEEIFWMIAGCIYFHVYTFGGFIILAALFHIIRWIVLTVKKLGKTADHRGE